MQSTICIVKKGTEVVKGIMEHGKTVQTERSLKWVQEIMHDVCLNLYHIHARFSYTQDDDSPLTLTIMNPGHTQRDALQLVRDSDEAIATQLLLNYADFGLQPSSDSVTYEVEVDALWSSNLTAMQKWMKTVSQYCFQPVVMKVVPTTTTTATQLHQVTPDFLPLSRVTSVATSISTDNSKQGRIGRFYKCVNFHEYMGTLVARNIMDANMPKPPSKSIFTPIKNMLWKPKLTGQLCIHVDEKSAMSAHKTWIEWFKCIVCILLNEKRPSTVYHFRDATSTEKDDSIDWKITPSKITKSLISIYYQGKVGQWTGREFTLLTCQMDDGPKYCLSSSVVERLRVLQMIAAFSVDYLSRS